MSFTTVRTIAAVTLIIATATNDIGKTSESSAAVASTSVACRNDFFKCYGSNLAERVNIMGVGDQLSLENARPWRERITWHTGIDPDDWKVDWASGAAMLRGTESFERIPNPSLIDI